MNFEELKLGFIGAGNMNKAILGGLVEHGFESRQIIVSNPSEAKLKALQVDYGINTSTDNQAACQFADIVILGVKPNLINKVCQEISAHIEHTLIISIAAGITTIQIRDALEGHHQIVRAMPNTPCLYGQGMVGLYANDSVNHEQRDYSTNIFSQIAQIAWFDNEENMDLVTAISGSGPAYFFYIAEAMIQAAESQGMKSEQAKLLVTETIAGAATMLQKSASSATELRRAVTSPGGTTAAALSVLQAKQMDQILAAAIQAAERRGKELAHEND